MDRWIGRVALVTGAGSGIGASIAEKLVKYGMKVVGCDKNIFPIKELALTLNGTKGSLHTVECDLRQEDQILSMFKEIRCLYGGVDICVNSAGLGYVESLISGSTEKWREILDINVLALSTCTREAIQSMKERGVDDGHIIHMCSIHGHAVPPGYDSPMYCASKFAVRALTEALRNELLQIKSKIRISSFSPGVVKTGFAFNMRGERGQAFYETNAYLTADDIADSMIYVLSAPPHVQVHDVVIHPLMKPVSE